MSSISCPLAVQSMFPLANLQNHGLDGNHPRSPRFWLTRKNGKLAGALSVTKEGMLMPQSPDMDWAGMSEALRGLDLIGIIGPSDQSRSLLDSLDLNNVKTTLDHDEPQYSLDLSDLIIPKGRGDIFQLASANKEEMIRWRRDYDIETLNSDFEEASVRAPNEYESYCAENSHVTLMDGDTALCTTGFNARLPEIVQIGGVYTPPKLRNRAHAKRAVALHLQQAKSEGVKRATLFSANEFASRAYQAIGFTYIGQWTLCLFDGKQRVNE